MSVLDDKILDSTSPDLSSTSDHRRPSYDQTTETSGFSHRDSVWSDFSQPVSNQSRQTSHLGHALFNPPPPFMRVDSDPSYGHWPVSKDSGSCTPTGIYDQFSSDFDHGSSASFSGGAVGPVGPVNPINIPSMSYRPGMSFGPPGAVAMSPQSSHGWVPADMPEVSRSAKSPTYRNSSPMSLRRDGIRKKNARFEIPAERTLSNIDQLISQSTNEEEIKELKQQKRLLRNRQAAYVSSPIPNPT